MRIPFPERFPIDRVAAFAVLLGLIQQIEGTKLYFSVGCIAFILLAALAFNTGGGLSRTSGAYVFFYSFLVVIVGLCYKALLAEPGESNLQDPKTTIEVYVAGMAAMLAAVTVSRHLSRKTTLLRNMLRESDMYRASVGSMVFAIAGPYLIYMLGPSGAKLNTVFTQLNNLLPLGIILGIFYEIRRSGGTRSVNLPVGIACAYLFFIYGILGFSKQGILTPLLCWILPVCALRFRVTALQVASSLLGLFIIFQFLVPYAQYGRRFITTNMSLTLRAEVAMRLLSHPDETRRLYNENQIEVGAGTHYYNTPQGFWDRLTFIAVDDSLINITDQGSIFGYSPIIAAAINVVPHVILPDKPTMNFGNVYQHEIGGLPADDTTTGISFSPTAEAYHMGQWVGILVVAPLIWGLVFIVFDSIFGDLRTTPWGILVLAILTHTAPEGALVGAIYFLTYELAAFLFCVFFATWVAPAVASVVLGRDRSKLSPKRVLQPALNPRVPQ